MRRNVLAIVAVLGLALAGSAAAQAVLTEAELDCQKTVARKGRSFFKKTYKALEKCEKKVGEGDLPSGTDCAVEPATEKKLDKAAASLRGKVLDKCPDVIVAGLDFGSTCFGVTAGTALATCLVDEHSEAASALVDVVYDDDAAPLLVDQQACKKELGKRVLKQANKRQALFQKCKKKIALGKLPEATDCIAAAQAKLDKLLARNVEKIRAACPDAVTASLEFGGDCEGETTTDGAAGCALCSGKRATDGLIWVQHGADASGGTALAKQITDTADCVEGPLSRCRAGDYLLANDRIRIVIQDIQRNLFGVGQFGGQIIDADLVRQGADPDRDNFEEWSVSLNIEGTAHYTSLSVLNDGSDGGPAVIHAEGVDDLLDFLNASSVVADFGFTFPASADDVDLPLTISTDYILEPGENYVRVETTVKNIGGSSHDIFFGEYINGSGQVELFQPGYGFGEPLVSTRCPTSAPNLCNFVAYSGEDEAAGVSYGYVHDTPGSSTFTTSGVSVPLLGVEVVLALIGVATPPFTIEASGSPGDSLTFTRHFVVGDGSVASIVDARNEIDCLLTGRLQGTVTAGGSPVAGADIAVLGDPADGPGLGALDRNVVTHTRTDAEGWYSLTLPEGDYDVVANLDGWPYEGGGPTPAEHPVTIEFSTTVEQDIALPDTGAVQVTVVDESSSAIAAKASVVGFDPSLDPRNNQNILGLIGNNTGVFGERRQDGLPFGVAQSIFIDDGGDSGVVPLEPGDYRVVVSHGPEYSIDEIDIAVAAGATSAANAQVERVIDTTGFISSDFHVHSINSADTEVSNEERVISMLAEGVDFFASTDHDIVVDFQPVVASLGVSSLVSTTPGEEITTFDYGHFIGWPLAVNVSQANGGAVDHGVPAPDGEDFPSLGNYSAPPVDIIDDARWQDLVAGNETVQINHIHSHFGLQGGSGLAIDTGLEPPASGVPGAVRRLDPTIPNYFAGTFDGLEIWIGGGRGQIFGNFLGENAGDWFNLLNQGIGGTGIANSDTHRRHLTQAGLPRSMVASLVDAPLLLDAATVSGNVNDGRLVGTNAPMVRVTVFASSTGESGGLDLGRCTGLVDCTNTSDCPPCTDDLDCGGGESCTALPTAISTDDDTVTVTVDIQSPQWAEFDTVEYYVNTTTTNVPLVDQETGAGLIDVSRYCLTADAVQTAPGDFVVSPVAVPGTSSSRLEARATRSFTRSEDFWVVVMVRGTDGASEPLFPVIPNDLDQGGNTILADLIDGNLGEDGVNALAFTNPIFVDVDGGGWSAPGVQLFTCGNNTIEGCEECDGTALGPCVSCDGNCRCGP